MVGRVPVSTEAGESRRALYEREGLVRLGRVLDDAALARVRDGLASWLGPSPAATDHGVIRHRVWPEVPAVRDELVFSSCLQRAVRELLGEREVVLFQDLVIAKTPGTTARIDWHRDYSYWPLDVPRGVTTWVALDDATLENGCLRYQPGTHRLPRSEPDERAAVALPLAAGEAVAHDPLVWHMSPANPTAAARRGYTQTWIGAAVRWDPERAPHPYRYTLSPETGTLPRGDLFPLFAEERS